MGMSRPWSSLPGRRGVPLGLALRRSAASAIEARGHALLDIPPERLHRVRVVEVREPHLQSDDVRRARAGELVHEAQACDHVGRLDRRADHAEHQVVPVLVDLPAADVGLQLELEVPAVGVHLVLPLGADVLTEDHDGVDHVEPVGLLPHHALLLQELAGLRHVVPELPEVLHRREGRDLVSGVGVGRGLGPLGHDLLPDGPRVAEGHVLLEHLVILLAVRGELQVGVEALVEAEERHRRGRRSRRG
mmetsp:Transcript_117369/g.252362  ORF Transcript_117369/g.252362 Transcript_117369/m.252362 type:complete len:247 (+) Transcript_117369:287-1027(+)